MCVSESNIKQWICFFSIVGFPCPFFLLSSTPGSDGHSLKHVLRGNLCTDCRNQIQSRNLLHENGSHRSVDFTFLHDSRIRLSFGMELEFHAFGSRWLPVNAPARPQSLEGQAHVMGEPLDNQSRCPAGSWWSGSSLRPCGILVVVSAHGGMDCSSCCCLCLIFSSQCGFEHFVLPHNNTPNHTRLSARVPAG